MSTTVAFGNVPPFYTSGPPTTNTNTINFTGGPWTYIRTHVDSSAETIATWRLDEDTSASFAIANASATNTVFQPQIIGTATGTRSALETRGVITTDTGASPALWWNVRTAAAAAVTTRPIYEWDNNGTSVLQMLPLYSGANSAVSWGAQAVAAPQFSGSGRSAGTRLILYNALAAASADYAIGMQSSGMWFSTEKATSAYDFFWYGGTTQIARLRGDGVFQVGNASTLYSRQGQKLETNTSANYSGAALNTWSTTAAECSLLDFNRSKSATIGTQTIVASGDQLGAIGFRGADGSAFATGAAITAEVDGTPGASDMPGRLLFKTTADGAASAAERMRITNAGDVGIGKTPTTGIQLDLNGQLGLKSYTVATLPSASVQAGAMVFASDAGGNGPCAVVSNGTNWKRSDNASTTVT
jgi:hypothetical protein